MAEPYWTIIPPNVAQQPATRNFPAIDRVRGEGGAARMLQGREALGGYGFLDETIGPIADELGAGVSAAVDYGRGMLTGNPTGFGDLYDEHRSIIKAEQDAYREAHPVASVGANVLGGLAIAGPARGAVAAGGAVLGAGAPAATTLKEGIKQGVKAGAAWGAGVGAAEGDGVTGRLEGAAWGAGVGATLGFGIPLLQTAGSRIIGAVGRLKGLKGQGAIDRANQMLATALERDGITPAQLATIQARGKPLTVADLGPNTRKLVGAASRQGGEGAKILEDFFEARTLGQYGRMSDDLAATSGMRGQEFAATTGTITARRSADAAKGYPAAYAQPAPSLSENGRAILGTPAGRRAVNIATRMMENRRAAVTDEAGNYTVEMLDQIQRAMRDDATRASGNRAAEMSANIENVRGQFLRELPDDLRGVMANYRSESELLDAMEAGRAFLKGDAELAAAPLASMSPQQQDMFRLGVARELVGRMGQKIDSGDISGMFQNPQMRQRLGEIFPSKRMFQEFVERVRTERTMQETRNAILKGSQTAGRMVDDAEFSGGALGEFASDVATGGANVGSVTRAVINAAGRGKERFLQGVNEEVARGVANQAVRTDLRAMAPQMTPGAGLPALPYPVSPFALPATRATGVAASAAATSGAAAPQSYWTIVPPQ